MNNIEKVAIKQAEPNTKYEINGKTYDVKEVVVTQSGNVIPIVNLKMQSDYDWQRGCLKSRINNPEVYKKHDKDVNATIDHLYNWLIENENIEKGDVFDDELKQMYFDYKNSMKGDKENAKRKTELQRYAADIA